MTASVPWPNCGRPSPNTKIEYSFRSKQLHLLCKQVQVEVIYLCRLHVQNIRLRELGVHNFAEILATFEREQVLRHSVRNITLAYSTKIISAYEAIRDKCSFLTQVTENFLSLIKLCPNLESVSVSLLADLASYRGCQIGLFIPCLGHDETRLVRVGGQWRVVAEWERVIRKWFSSFQKGVHYILESTAVWEYSRGCTVHADINIVVSEEEERRAELGARLINATIASI